MTSANDDDWLAEIPQFQRASVYKFTQLCVPPIPILTSIQYKHDYLLLPNPYHLQGLHVRAPDLPPGNVTINVPLVAAPVTAEPTAAAVKALAPVKVAPTVRIHPMSVSCLLSAARPLTMSSSVRAVAKERTVHVRRRERRARAS